MKMMGKNTIDIKIPIKKQYIIKIYLQVKLQKKQKPMKFPGANRFSGAIFPQWFLIFFCFFPSPDWQKTSRIHGSHYPGTFFWRLRYNWKCFFQFNWRTGEVVLKWKGFLS
jgi:hypothetical protein